MKAGEALGIGDARYQSLRRSNFHQTWQLLDREEQHDIHILRETRLAEQADCHAPDHYASIAKVRQQSFDGG